MTFRVELTETALAQLEAVKDTRVRAALVKRMEKLATSPDQQGKALMAELGGYRSVRAVGQHWRIIYTVVENRVVVVVVALGLRKDSDKKDVYALARRMIKLGLLAEGEKDD
ncbi:MAG: type II toxin-antitoxin system RelE/ParE family toxin [Desulfovibrio sp.]|nr:MAG: type II toxin-antitoxin system RelE/ParE family toxin [Desulfovibrio sp.]